MGIFDKIEQNHSDDYKAVERIGNANQHHKLPMKDKADNFNVMRELDTTTPDQLMNMCKMDRDGEKRSLLVFYTDLNGNGKWMRIAMPRFRFRKYSKRGYFEVVDCATGKRKTFRRGAVKTVRKNIDKATGKWIVYKGLVDNARFK